MKRYLVAIFVFFLFQITAFSQVNPDGEAMSLHFLPYGTSGQYQSLDGTLSKGVENFGFEIKMMVPISKNFTLSTYYESGLYQYNINLSSSNNNRFTKSGFRQTKYGIGLHVYFH